MVRLTTCIILLCNLYYYSPASASSFPDDLVAVGGDEGRWSFSLITDKFCGQAAAAKYCGAAPSTFKVNEQSHAKEACGRGAACAKKSCKRGGLFCFQDDAPKVSAQETGQQQPLEDPKSEPQPGGSPASGVRPGEPYKGYEAWPSTNWMRRQPRLDRDIEDDKSKMCGK